MTNLEIETIGLARAPLTYSKWSHVARIKTNSKLLQLILKRSLLENRLTSDQSCLLLHGGKIPSDLFSPLPKVQRLACTH